MCAGVRGCYAPQVYFPAGAGEAFSSCEVYSVRDLSLVPLNSLPRQPDVFLIQSGAVKDPLSGGVFWSTISAVLGNDLIVFGFCGSRLDKDHSLAQASFECAILGFHTFVEFCVAHKLVV